MNVVATKVMERIRTQTSGRLDIRVLPSSQLGADTDMLSQVRSGALEFYSQSGLVLANIVPVAGINGIGHHMFLLERRIDKLERDFEYLER